MAGVETSRAGFDLNDKIELILALAGILDRKSSDVVWNFFADPKTHWQDVRDRAQMISELSGEEVSLRQFRAIAHPPDSVVDVFSSVVDAEQGLTTESPMMKAATLLNDPGTAVHRAFVTAISIGISKASIGGEDWTLFTAGLRRRTQVYNKSDIDRRNALELDLEYLVPAGALDAKGTFRLIPKAHSKLQLGMALRHAGSAIGAPEDGDLDMAALRVVGSVPFAPGDADPFGTPVVKVEQARIMKTATDADWNRAEWTEITKPEHWEASGNAFLQSSYVAGRDSLLAAPLGPLVEETLASSFSAMRKGRAAVSRRKEQAGTAWTEGKAELKKAFGANDARFRVPEEDDTKRDRAAKWQETETVGRFFESLGFLRKLASGKPDLVDPGYGLSTFDDIKKISFWTVLSRIAVGLDGFPIVSSGFSKNKATPADPAAGTEAQEAEPPSMLRGAFELAAVQDETTLVGSAVRDFFGIRGALWNFEAIKPKKDVPETERNLRLLLQAGRWFSDETADDNWVRRLLPTITPSSGPPMKPAAGAPGLGFYPLVMDLGETGEAAGKGSFGVEYRADLMSFGFDVEGMNDFGLYETKNKRFRIGGVEARVMFSGQQEKVKTWSHVFAIGVKVTGLRISLAPEKKEDAPQDDAPAAPAAGGMNEQFLDGLSELFADPAEEGTAAAPASAPAEEEEQPAAPEQTKRKTRSRMRMSEADDKEMKNGFDVSVGYMTPTEPHDETGTFDVQLWNSKGKRGGLIHIPIDRRVLADKLYIKSVGIGLKKVEVQKPTLLLSASGGIRFESFELGVIDAGAMIPLKDPKKVHGFLNGLDIAINRPSFQLSGVFMKKETAEYDKDGNPIRDAKGTAKTITQYGGEARLQTTPLTIGLMGAGGKLGGGGTSFFLYGTLSIKDGVGIGPPAIFALTGVALGFGLNRSVVVPAIQDVASFPLVQLVMGEGGLNPDAKEDDPLSRRAQTKSADDLSPVEVFDTMLDSLRATEGQKFFAVGLRATIVKYVDAFLLLLVQWGNSLEISVIGLGRLRLPEKGSAIAYVELSVLLDIKTEDKVAMLMAELTPNSWALDSNCQLTGGFAFMYWWGEKHKGDFVVTLGGYHPRFQRPAYFPNVKRVGFNWPITDHLKAKGGVYFALTPNAIMAGGRFEGTFSSGPVGASLTAYIDALIEWDPTYWQISAGFSIKAWADLALFTIHITLSVDAAIMGQPFHGSFHMKVGPIGFTITFGNKSSKPPRIKSWPRFGRTHIDQIGADGEKADTTDTRALGKWAEPEDKPVPGPNILGLRLVAGDRTKQSGKKDPKKDWVVRADELAFGITTQIPASTVEAGSVSGGTWPTGFPDAGQEENKNTGTQTIVSALSVSDAHSVTSASKLGLRPMEVEAVETPLRVTVFRHVMDGSGVSLTVKAGDWRLDPERSGVPAAVWDTKPLDKKVPSAKMLEGVLAGLKSFRPPVGGPKGEAIGPVLRKDLGHDELKTQHPVAQKMTATTAPEASTSTASDFASKAATRHQMAKTLHAFGFDDLPTTGDAAFRPVNSEPMRV